MLYIFHGPGVLAKDKKISDIKKNFDPLSTVVLSGKDTSPGELKVELSTQGLFQTKRLLILENFTDLKLSDLPEDEDTTVVLSFSKQLPVNSTLLKGLPKGSEVTAFKEESEVEIFPFLDKLAEKNPAALKELDKILNNFGSQYLLTMLCYLLRRFILKGKNLPPFVIQKIQSQKKNFPKDRIKGLYLGILETDFKIKSGLIDEKIGIHLLTEKFLI